VVATYASVLAVCSASLLLGEAAIRLCGRRRHSWLAPAAGLAILCALCWATVRLPGDGTVSAIAVLLLCAISAVYVARGGLEGGREALRAGAPVAILALLAASLPFLAEGRFGILGTSFNPDMSQHLLAAERLAAGDPSRLLTQGYPLGPHAVVVALNRGLGVGVVQGFGGFTLAVALLACLTALGALASFSAGRRLVGALLVGLPYMVASYLAQGAFKETTQALFVLAFAIGLMHLREPEERSAWGDSSLAAVPLALIAVGSVYVYSFPGLGWLAGTAAIWAAAVLGDLWLQGRRMAAELAAALRPAALALLAFFVLSAPEIGRMVDFGGFETFDPAGPGLGNLFGQISPFEALGIWPSGDFRLTPGAGAVPAVGYYVGVALALALLLHGLVWSLRRRELAIPAALAAALGLYAAARLGGTPYTAAKAVVMISPAALLLIVRPLLELRPATGDATGPRGILEPLAAAAFVVGAGACTALALANAPVGPTAYTPKLTELRPTIAASSTQVLAPPELVEHEHGVPYLAWELRGGRVCIDPDPGGLLGPAPPSGVRFVIVEADRGGRPYRRLRLARRAGPYLLWKRVGPLGGRSACPLIAVRQARQGPARG
jgi:hypothetical protein